MERNTLQPISFTDRLRGEDPFAKRLSSKADVQRLVSLADKIHGSITMFESFTDSVCGGYSPGFYVGAVVQIAVRGFPRDKFDPAPDRFVEAYFQMQGAFEPGHMALSTDDACRMQIFGQKGEQGTAGVARLMGLEQYDATDFFLALEYVLSALAAQTLADAQEQNEAQYAQAMAWSVCSSNE